MLLYILATFGFVFALSDASASWDQLLWPESYSIKASKLSLTSNLIEDFQEWRSNTSSRIDYNGGSVKSISTVGPDSDTELNQYEIHPETTDGEESEYKCYVTPMEYSLAFVKSSILPPIDQEEYEYEAVGNETILEKETVKWEYIDINPTKEERKTIWAEYVDLDDESIWIPVRYEKKEYNSVLGSLLTHEIWDFFEFHIHVDDDVFSIANDYNCDASKWEIHDADSDKVIKELMFINPGNKKHVDHVFNKYILNFERKYTHEKEHAMRKAIFNQNMRMVSAINRKNAGYKLAINHFSDRTPQEMERSRGLKMRTPGKTGNIAFPYDENKLNEIVDELPKEYDSRNLNLVSPVKNQGDCGSCWSFGTTSAVEGALARKNGGRLLSLSNQALIDCVWPYGAKGCEGGSDNAAYEWMMIYGLPTEEEYGSYKNKDDVCRIANMTKTYRILGYTDVTPFSDSATKVALINNGPLSVSVHVSDQFTLYSSGIFYQKDCSPTELNHEVTLVGYGERDGDLFWILKNSWGPNWGIDGYILIAARDNTCGTTTEPTFVVI